MSNYGYEYEKYYNNIKKSTRARNQTRRKPSYDTNNILSQKNYLVKKMIVQLVGALILVVSLLIMKVIPDNKLNDTYILVKYELNKNIDIQEYIDSVDSTELQDFKDKAIECIEEIKRHFEIEETNV